MRDDNGASINWAIKSKEAIKHIKLNNSKK